MTPALIDTKSALETSGSLKPSSILHRTPWRPPIAESAKGSYVTLEDGRVLLDAVGGAAVACIGNGHPDVVQAMKDQVDKVSCMLGLPHIAKEIDIRAFRCIQHATFQSTR